MTFELIDVLLCLFLGMLLALPLGVWIGLFLSPKQEELDVERDKSILWQMVAEDPFIHFTKRSTFQHFWTTKSELPFCLERLVNMGELEEYIPERFNNHGKSRYFRRGRNNAGL